MGSSGRSAASIVGQYLLVFAYLQEYAKSKQMPDSVDELPMLHIESRILLAHGQKVILDSDLAELYGVATKALNQAVKRNQQRFPEDFMFRLTLEEGRHLHFLRSQTVTLERGQYRKYAPYVFTELGIAMLSSVLTSKRAIEVNIVIMRTFVRLRQLLATHEELAQRLENLEWRQNEQAGQIQVVFEAIQQLIEAPAKEESPRRIGFPISEAVHEG